MSGAAVLVADGFETVECLTVVDVLRRGGVRCSLVSIMSTRDASSSQHVNIVCNLTIDEIDFDDYDCVVLPGGMPGTTHLLNDKRVCDMLREFARTKLVGAICTAPMILGKLGLLGGRRATCFPGFERSLCDGSFVDERTVVVDGNIITATAMAQSLPFALALLQALAGEWAVEKLKEGIRL